tara:strand:+ start:708 stop:1226 length:519 start_codon:yes stop_codon:yes gene_type:complete
MKKKKTIKKSYRKKNIAGFLNSPLSYNDILKKVIALLKKVIRKYYINGKFIDDPMTGLIMVDEITGIGIDNYKYTETDIENFSINFVKGRPQFFENGKWNGFWYDDPVPISISKDFLNYDELINLYLTLVKWKQKKRHQKPYLNEDEVLLLFHLKQNNMNSSIKKTLKIESH